MDKNKQKVSFRKEIKSFDSMEFYKTLFEYAPDPYYITDLVGNFLDGNKAAEKITGYQRKELIGKNFFQLNILPTYEIPKAQQAIARNQQGLATGPDEFTLKRKDNIKITVEIFTYPLKIEGKPLVLAIARDISERKRAEKALSERVKELNCLYRVSKIMGDPNISVHQALQSIVEILPSAWQYPEFICASIKLKSQDYQSKNFRVTKWKQSSSITVKKQAIGELEVYYLKPISQSVENFFLKEEYDLIDSLARRISQYLEVKKTEEALKNSEEYSRSIIEVMPDIIFRISQQGIYLDVISSSKEMLFLPKNELLGKNLKDTLPEKTAIRALAYINKALKSKALQVFEYEMEVPAGNLWFEARLLPFGKGEVFILIRNISERKEMEDSLRKSRQEFASLFQSNPEATVYTDEKGNIIDLNSKFTELFGYTLEEIKGKNIDSGLIQPQHKLQEARRLTEEGKKEQNVNIETIRKKKDGALFPVYISGSPVIIDGKQKGIIAAYYDITERKKIEKQLEEMVRIDSLTGCYSRKYGLELLDRQIKLSQRNKTHLLLAFLDIDNFKTINDTFGHDEGDDVLKEVVRLFKSTLREVDIICRMGGDEFLLVFPESSLGDVRLIRNRLEEKLHQLNCKIEKNYQIQFSIGFSEYDPKKPKSLDKLIAIADQQMYKEKKYKNK